MKGFPGIGCLMLGDAVGVFAGMGVLAKIGFGRNGAADIDQGQP